MRLAEELGLELVEVNPRAAPPVCKIMDFGKFKYETSKKEKASRKHQSTILLKEIKLRPKTDDHDLDFKVKHIRRFLSEGNKCKLVTVFRGREIVHPETGQRYIDHGVDTLAAYASAVHGQDGWGSMPASFGNLIRGTAEIKELIRELRAQGKTIVLSGHLLADMQDICDRIAILHRGALRELGRVNELLKVQDVTQIKVRDLPPSVL